jgi:EAL domain-containing protein (putative c-di-GMP-specific phosphodiesterase class I)
LTSMGAQFGQGYLFQRPQLLDRPAERLAPARTHSTAG